MKAEDYTLGDVFQVEKRTIFAKEWLPLCAEGQLAGPGAFLAASVGGWSVFGIRDEAGTLRVMRNACRHQNMPLVGSPPGICESLRCRFHGWTYDLQGRFVGAPPPVAPSDPKSSAHHLQVLETEVRSGLVFFSMGNPAAPVETSAIDGKRYGATITTEIACNWKVAAEELMVSLANFTWHWPLVAVRNGRGGVIVDQVVPHTFLKTRLLTHVFGSADGLKPALDALKQACERRQVTNLAAPNNARVVEFHRRISEAYAGDQSGSS